MMISRSVVSSPTPNRETPNKLFNLTSEFKGKLSTLPSRLGTESSLKDNKLEFYEVEKREIQGQLKCLKDKLEVLEKYARNIIDSSIQRDLNILQKNQEVNDKFKIKMNKSHDESILRSHISILEVEIAQKNLENLENENLPSSFNAEKIANHQPALDVIEKDYNLKELAPRVQELESELEMSQEIYFCTKNKLESCESLLAELKVKLENVILEKERIEKTVQELKESNQLHTEYIQIKDIRIRELNAELNSYKNFLH